MGYILYLYAGNLISRASLKLKVIYLRNLKTGAFLKINKTYSNFLYIRKNTITIMEQYYIYYPEKIRIIGIVPLNKLRYYTRRYNLKKTTYFIKLWLNSFCHIFDYLSYKEIFMMVKSMGLVELPDEIILDILKKYNIDDDHFLIETHFKWNKELLYRDFKSKIEVDKVKRKIINKHIAENKSIAKENIVLNVINYNDLTKRELIKKLENEVSHVTIDKVLKNNNIILNKQNNTEKHIHDKLSYLLNYRVDHIKIKLTDKVLADYCEVSLSSIKRYKKPFQKEIIQFNKYITFKNKL